VGSPLLELGIMGRYHIPRLFVSFLLLPYPREGGSWDAPNNDRPSTETNSLTPKYSAASPIAGE